MRISCTYHCGILDVKILTAAEKGKIGRLKIVKEKPQPLNPVKEAEGTLSLLEHCLVPSSCDQERMTKLRRAHWGMICLTCISSAKAKDVVELPDVTS